VEDEESKGLLHENSASALPNASPIIENTATFPLAPVRGSSWGAFSDPSLDNVSLDFVPKTEQLPTSSLVQSSPATTTPAMKAEEPPHQLPLRESFEGRVSAHEGTGLLEKPLQTEAPTVSERKKPKNEELFFSLFAFFICFFISSLLFFCWFLVDEL
jgi:hypothetical protein